MGRDMSLPFAAGVPAIPRLSGRLMSFQQCFNILGGHHRGMFRHEGAKGEDEGMNMYELYIIESKSHITYIFIYIIYSTFIY